MTRSIIQKSLNACNGNNSYWIHSNKIEVSPNDPKAFWSLTVYDADYFLDGNSINRYNIGIVTEDLCMIPMARLISTYRTRHLR
jgi:hypothetical protein